MAEALCEPLYPENDARRGQALSEAAGTSGFLRLAQEYQVAFGPSALNDKIRSLVPDLDYRPADLHKRLLRLPWADVFSTNWDTLLERSCVDVFDRSYDVIRTVNEIPFAMRPRIVKLHGTFPAHEPFIFTEEEYRTYPEQFSPFVNLVQQSMMETIFCLIGFSGDDPNFLHWSGWVRDNLGAGAPRIYLAGWLGLSNHRRRMLEARNVMPIDLSALPQANTWPPDLRDRYATEWFITALELGKPSGFSHWPSPPTAPAAPPPHLGPVPASEERLPLEENWPAPFTSPANEHEQALRSIIGIWRENRRLYPGWLVAPGRVREKLWQSTQVWLLDFSRHLQALSVFERLTALAELAWRLEHALVPFHNEFEEAAYSGLEAVNRIERTVDGAPIPEGWSWSDVSDGVDTLALALARIARHVGDRARFERALGFLKPRSDHVPALKHAIAYEECQWRLATGDLKGLLALLDTWIPDQTETLWTLRKAGLLAEMREHRRACSLLETTLVQIRRSRRRDLDDIASLSLEGWALYLALAYSDHGLSLGLPVLPKDAPEPFERWQALGTVDCNAFSDYRTLAERLSAAKPRSPPTIVKRGFDLDHVSVSHHFESGASPDLIEAYQMTMLAEITGIPSAANHAILFEQGLVAASKILAPHDPWLACQLAIRMEKHDKLIDDVFSRARVARLSQHDVELSKEASLRRLAFGRELLGLYDARFGDVTQFVGASVEVLSRVAVRLNREQLRQLFLEATSYYRTPVFRRWFRLLGSHLANLLARILETLSRVDIISLLPLLFELPLPQEDTPIDPRVWKDPVAELPDWFDGAVEHADTRSVQWEGIVSHLVIAAKSGNAANREAAMGRLYKLLEWNYLTDDEKKSFAVSLWMPDRRDSYGLPKDTNLRPWTLLKTPEEQPGQAREALLQYIAGKAREKGGDIYERVIEIGELLWSFGNLKIDISLSQDVQKDLTSLVEAWAAHRTPSRPELTRMMNRRDQTELAALDGISTILRYVSVSEGVVEAVWKKVDAIDTGPDSGVRAFAIYPFLVRSLPNLRNELLDRLRRALVSDRETEVRLGTRGLFLWIKAQDSPQESDGDIDDLVREVGIGIAARRVAILSPGLGFTQWLFREGPERLRPLVVQNCEHGLMALLEEASYLRPETAFDVPSIRAGCYRLAAAMAKAGFAESRAVTRWLAAAKDDPLPEVRNAEIRETDQTRPTPAAGQGNG